MKQELKEVQNPRTGSAVCYAQNRLYFNACKALSLSSSKILLETHLFCGALHLTRATHHAISALYHSVLSCAVPARAPKLQALPEGKTPIYLTQFSYCTQPCVLTSL